MLFTNFIKSQSIIDIFDDLDYNTKEILDNLSGNISEKLQSIVLSLLNDNSYLKTVKIQGAL